MCASPQTISTFYAWIGPKNKVNIQDAATGKSVALDDAISNNGPALAVFDGQLYLAWTGTDGQLNVASSSDGGSWNLQSPFGQMGQYSSAGPTLVAFEDVLCLVWAGKDSGQSLNLMTWDPTNNWGPATTVTAKNSPITSLTPAAAAVSFQAPYYAWIAPSGQIYFRMGEKNGFAASSPFGPALAFCNGQLYLAWTSDAGAGNPGVLNVRTSTNGLNWTATNAMPSPLKSPLNGPALAAVPDNSAVYLAWTGGDNAIYVLPLLADGTWGSPTPISDAQSSQPPAIAVGVVSGNVS